jgi:hypothetical protein
MKSAIITFAIIVSTLTDLFAFSDSLMTRIVLLEKEIMLAETDSSKVPLLMDKAMAYRKLQQYNDALFTLGRVNFDLLGAENKQAYYYEKAVDLYMIDAFSEALAEIRSLRYEFDASAEEVELLGLILLLENGMWPEFKENYLLVAGRQGKDTAAFISQFEPPMVLDPYHYRRLSGIVPGLGLMKSGYVKKGLTSMSLQLLSAGFAAYNFYHGFYFTGVFSGLMPARKYYRGGKILTFTTIEKANADNLEAFKKLGYQHLQHLYGH